MLKSSVVNLSYFVCAGFLMVCVDLCLKIHTRKDPFRREVAVLSDLNSPVPDNIKDFVPRITVHSVEFGISLPYCHDTLASADFTQPLFVSACRGAGVLLPWLHSRNIAYCDPSPANVLVFKDPVTGLDKAWWNDFADTFPLDTEMKVFQGKAPVLSLVKFSMV